MRYLSTVVFVILVAVIFSSFVYSAEEDATGAVVTEDAANSTTASAGADDTGDGASEEPQTADTDTPEESGAGNSTEGDAEPPAEAVEEPPASSESNDTTASEEESQNHIIHLPVTFYAAHFYLWQEGDISIFLGNKGFSCTFDGKTLSADRGVIWFDEKKALETGVTEFDVYAEGNVKASFADQTVLTKKLFLHITSDQEVVFDDDDHNFVVLKDITETGFYGRGMRAKSGETVLPSEVEDDVDLPEDIITEAKPPSAGRAWSADILPIEKPAPFSIEQIFSTQKIEGLTLEKVEEGERTLWVVKGGVDIVGAGSQIPGGQFEMLAENIVLWINEEKYSETNDLSRSDVEIYAEGNVTFYYGGEKLTAARIFYDLTTEKAVMFDSVIETEVPQTGSSVFLKTGEVQQINRGYSILHNVQMTNCDFAQPHVWMQSEVVYYTEKDDTRLLEAYNNTVWILGVPVFYWPYIVYDVDGDTGLRSVSYSNSSKFGNALFTEWDLLDLGVLDWVRVGPNKVKMEEFTNWYARVDYMNARGIGLGSTFNYEITKDKPWPGFALPSTGEITGYYVHDRADFDSRGPFESFPIPDKDRGRVRWQDRTLLGDRTNIDFEISYFSDEGFQEEYFEREAKEETYRDNVAYLKHLEDYWAFTGQVRFRMNDFFNDTEYLPQARFQWIGPSPFNDNVFTFFSDTQAAYVRNRVADSPVILPNPLNPTDNEIGRFATLNQMELPIDIGAVNINPYVGFETAYFSDSIAGGSEGRVMGVAGVRGSTQFQKVYDCHNALLDINRLRHVIIPNFEYINWFASNVAPSELYQYDSVDARGEYEEVRLGIRQRFQTMRRQKTPTGVSGLRSVDFMRLDMNLSIFPDADRDNDGKQLGDLDIEHEWQITDIMRFLSDAEIDVEDGWKFDKLDFGLSLNRSPDMTFYVGNRYIRGISSSAFTFAVDYKLTPKWGVSLFEQYDFDRSALTEQRFAIRRILHKWVVEFEFLFDDAENNKSFTVLFYPEGVRNTFLGM